MMRAPFASKCLSVKQSAAECINSEAGGAWFSIQALSLGTAEGSVAGTWRRHCHSTKQAAATPTVGYWGHAATHPSAAAGRAGLGLD